MNSEDMREALCKAFCGDLTVREVPAGIAISAMFEGSDGDRLGALLEQTAGGWRISDDGSFLANLEGSGIEIRKGTRADYLTRVLAPIGAFVDEATLQITSILDEFPTPIQLLEFLSVQFKVQNVGYWTKERIKSTFREDATQAVRMALGGTAIVEESSSIDEELIEFPPDLVIRPTQYDPRSSVTAVFLVQAVTGLQEALLLAQELRVQGKHDVKVTALVEESNLNLGSLKVTRAFNRINAVSFFRNDEAAAALKIAREAVPTLPSFRQR